MLFFLSVHNLLYYVYREYQACNHVNNGRVFVKTPNGRVVTVNKLYARRLELVGYLCISGESAGNNNIVAQKYTN